MADWYYLEGQTSRGPAPEAELRSLLRERRLPPHVLVWREGMDEWATAESLGLVEVVEAGHADEPESAQSTAGSRQAPVAVTLDLKAVAWRRLIARLIDMALFKILLLVMMATSMSPEAILTFLTEQGVYWPVIAFALFIPVEALLLSRAGRTPGKRVLGLWVTDAEGQLLTYRAALERSFKVYFFGQACGLPIALLVVNAFAYQRYLRAGTTVWDVMSSSHVVVEELTPARRNLVSIMIFVYIGIMFWLTSEVVG